MTRVAKERDCCCNKLEFDTDYSDNLHLTSQEHRQNSACQSLLGSVYLVLPLLQTEVKRHVKKSIFVANFKVLLLQV